MNRETVERFMKRFRGLDRAYGIYLVSKKTKKKKVTGKAQTIRGVVTEAEWRDHLTGKKGLGIVPVDDEGVCLFGAIDVDIYDLNLEALEEKTGRLGFPLITCRTKSGGAHLYIFFKEPVRASVVRERLMELAVVLGYPNSEVFPKQTEIEEDDVGSWINMPYFGGDSTTRYGVRKGVALTTIEFLDYADKSATSQKKFEALKIPVDDRLADGPPCLQHLSSAGFPEGTRNKSLFNLGVYCKMRFGDDWKDKVDEFNQTFVRPPLSSGEVKIIIGSLLKKKYFYTCKDSPIVHACNRVICMRRQYGIGGGDRDPGIVLDGLVKIQTDPPTWAVNVDGRRISLSTTDDLLNQAHFAEMCVNVINVLPQKISRNSWDELVRGLLEKVEEIDAPEDASHVGQFKFLLDQFCVEQTPARDREELLLGKPWIEEDYVYFRSTDLLSFLDKKKLRVTPREAWGVLRTMKGKPKEFKIKGRCVRCWGVPTRPRQTKPFEVPKISDEEEY